MSVLQGCEPEAVFRFFEEICGIPHGSFHTDAISEYCVQFASARGLWHKRDEYNNVLIVKEGTPGYEQADTVILQGHLDMVCACEPGCDKDMSREGLELVVDGDTVSARGTTLGGDDGIAVAIILAVLDSDQLQHPRIEALLTSDEEVGMLGAKGLDAESLQGRRMINIDSEEEGVIFTSCAGGITLPCSVPLVREAYEGVRCTVAIQGGLGGHSGIDIGAGRANSNQLMGQYLTELLNRQDIRLVSVEGGGKDNAIPDQTSAVLLAQAGEAAEAVAQELAAQWKNAYGAFDPDISISAEIGERERAQALDADGTRKVADFLFLAPTGVVQYSPNIPGLVQTSLNFGIAKTTDTALQAVFLVRSSAASEKTMLVRKVERFAASYGGTVQYENDYPAWEYRQTSALRDLMSALFAELYGKRPELQAIHAGLECGILCGKISGLDCVSIGPALADVHTPRERFSIASVRRTWEYVTQALGRMRE